MFGNNKENTRDAADIVGEHIETFLAVLVQANKNIQNFGVGNIFEVAGERYAYRLALHNEGTEGYQQIYKQKEEAIE